jgi:hypothetical protein
VFVDFALSDVDKAVPVLKQIAAENKLTDKTWLRFYDVDWRGEWVALTNSTTAPDQSGEVW